MDNAEVLFEGGYVKLDDIKVAQPLYDLVDGLILPDLGLSSKVFWADFAKLVDEFGTRNDQLLTKRDQLQEQLDQWCREHQDKLPSPDQSQAFLTQIGYLTDPPQAFQIKTDGVDREIALVSGPQLVVPVSNARYALNAANARWGSLYDAFYGTDVIAENDGAERGDAYNPIRGQKVVAQAAELLDQIIPLNTSRHSCVVSYDLVEGANGYGLSIKLEDDSETTLKHNDQFVGFQGAVDAPTALLFIHNDLYLELQIDPTHPIGSAHPAGLKDVLLEAAVTTIQDCEDSVAAVDAEDKALVYQNWLGLMRGDLSVKLQKGNREIERKLVEDRRYVFADTTQQIKEIVLPGRSLLLIRNVGLLMKTDAVLFKHKPVAEGILDAWITSTIALYDLRGLGQYRNSRSGNVYIVKPKLHGPEEVAFTCDLFKSIEEKLELEPNTLKMGIMDEERRTTLNLMSCIEVAKERVIFINTGFLDRTGDEIHSSMQLGPMVPKNLMKSQTWINAYERWNVDCGLSAGFYQKAQIGKGMWAMPDKMAQMLAQKQGHPEAGASCAWVPSPTAATLHAIHYHQVQVPEVQKQLFDRTPCQVSDLLMVPIHSGEKPDDEQIQQELDNNVQGILGYVVRWIDQGVGCSKVPDIHDVGLMEDRATLRISSQHIANWLCHGWVSEAQVLGTLKRMAEVVDRQNASDPLYLPMSIDLDQNIAFQAACDLIFRGAEQPNGYTEPVLHARRKEYKAKHPS